ncbi:MAG TPA: insulinase family protein [Thermoanaerobaculia bacterium]|nr:insulinase family protein [Thermoanaerobaculia bacterium]
MKQRFLLLLLTLSALVGSACATAPASPQTAPEAAMSHALPEMPTDLAAVLPTDPAIQTGKLENGLTYYVRRNGVPSDRVELWLVVNAGSVLEEENQRGLAHFIEHMAFNGTQHFAKQELVKYLESIGMRFGADINASTNFDETIYTLTVPTDKPEFLEKGVQFLEDWAHGITFDPEEVDKERGVVIEEWRLGRGASARMFDQQFPVLFQGSRYAERVPIGKKEILEKATPDDLRRFYTDWYRPDLMAVIAVGDVDPAQMKDLIRQHFSRIPAPQSPRERPLYPVPEHADTLVAVATDPEATDTTLSVYSKLPAREQDRLGDYRTSIVEGLYHAMLNARLEEISRKPDAPFLYASSGAGLFVRSSEMTVQQAAVREGQVETGLAALLTEIERVRRHGFTPTELARVKKDWQLAYEQAYSERRVMPSAQLAAEYSRGFLEAEPLPGVPAELVLVRRFLPEISVEEVNHLAEEWLRDSNRVILVQAPAKPGEQPPSRDALLAVFQKVRQSDVAAYVDRVQAGPLVATAPQPGKIVKETKIPELGVTEWKLSNGVRVILKPTSAQRDEILLTAFSPGGHSLVPDEDFPSALFAATVIGEGGVGSFDKVTLEKALAGSTARVEPYITELEEGVQGTASTADAETLFQLVYLTITQPRKDPDTFRSLQTLLRSAVQNRLAEPEAVFADRMKEAMTQHHPRWQPITSEWIDKIDLDKAEQIYRDRFADAGDFTFILVGNVSPSKLKPLVLTWLGSLPSTGRNETWRDVGMRPPSEVVNVRVEKGIEPKSQVEIVFTGPAEYNRQGRHDLGALSTVLETRLREVLREDMGAVYGVSVNGDLSRRPWQSYQVGISFGCAPEKVDDLVKAVFAEISSIQANGVAEPYLNQVREAERRSRELNLTDNQFWLSALELYYTEGLDPRDILHFDQLISTITSDRMRDTARRYLDTNRYALGVLSPEKRTEGVGSTLP